MVVDRILAGCLCAAQRLALWERRKGLLGCGFERTLQLTYCTDHVTILERLGNLASAHYEPAHMKGRCPILPLVPAICSSTSRNDSKSVKCFALKGAESPIRDFMGVWNNVFRWVMYKIIQVSTFPSDVTA